MNVELCPDCKSKIHWSETNCLKCRLYLGVPNQRELGGEYEVKALKKRRDQALSDVKKSGDLDTVKAFENAIKTDSKAVINISLKLLDDLLSKDDKLMNSYVMQVDGQMRKTAEQLNDLARRGTEGTLFGSYGPLIRYAVLSLDHKGLTSYGSCSITLADITLTNSATVMEENSYPFVRRHKIFPGDPIPPGYRATWADRHLLATAKLATKLSKAEYQSNPFNFGSVLLHCDGDRRTDDFMEVHIYGALDNSSFAFIALTKAKKKEKGMMKRVRDHARALNIQCDIE